MRRKLFSEEQIISILKEHEAGAQVVDLARHYGVGLSNQIAAGVPAAVSAGNLFELVPFLESGTDTGPPEPARRIRLLFTPPKGGG